MAGERMQYRGVNHVALVARDMAETVDFYEGVLEMPLVKTLEFPGGRGQHFFFDCGGGGTIAFFWFKDAPPAAPGIASRHADLSKGTTTAHASMNHLAITIPLERFDDYVERLRSRGVAVRIINHDDSPKGSSAVMYEGVWIRSMYFLDPNGIQMELAAFTRVFGPDDVKHDPVNEKGEHVARKPVQASRSPRKPAPVA